MTHFPSFIFHLDMSVQGVWSVGWSVPVRVVPLPWGPCDNLGIPKLLAQGKTDPRLFILQYPFE